MSFPKTVCVVFCFWTGFVADTIAQVSEPESLSEAEAKAWVDYVFSTDFQDDLLWYKNWEDERKEPDPYSDKIIDKLVKLIRNFKKLPNGSVAFNTTGETGRDRRYADYNPSRRPSAIVIYNPALRPTGLYHVSLSELNISFKFLSILLHELAHHYQWSFEKSRFFKNGRATNLKLLESSATADDMTREKWTVD